MQLSTTVNSKIIRALLIILATFLLFDCQFLLSDACYNRFLTPRPGPTHMAAVSARLRPEVKIKISARVKPDLNGKFQFGIEPGPAQKENSNFVQGPAQTIYFSDFKSDLFGLSDFNTIPFGCLHIINIFFFWWFIFLQFIKTTDLVLTTFSNFIKRKPHYTNRKNKIRNWIMLHSKPLSI